MTVTVPLPQGGYPVHIQPAALRQTGALLAALGAWLGMELVIYTMILASVLFVLYALARRMRVGAFGPAITIAAIMIAFYFF